MLLCPACLDAPGSSNGPDRPADASDDGLIAWYQMDQPPDDGVIVDAHGLAPGSCEVCPSLEPGHIGSAYRFDGVADEVVVPARPELHPAAGTVACWVYLLDGEPNMILSKPFGGETENSWLLYALGDGQLLFETVSNWSPSTTAPIGPDRWIHLAATWSSAGNVAYVDGTPVTGEGQGTLFDDNPMVFGADRDYGSPVYPLNGLVDDVRLYDRALDEAEIAALAAM